MESFGFFTMRKILFSQGVCLFTPRGYLPWMGEGTYTIQRVPTLDRGGTYSGWWVPTVYGGTYPGPR